MPEPIPTGQLIAAQTGSLRLLDSVRVIDVGDEATAYAATLLAELGAEVIRIESATPDAIRREPWRNVTHNAGKRSIALDADVDALPSSLIELIQGATVVIGPLDPKRLSHLVLDAASDVTSVVRTVDRRAAAITGPTPPAGPTGPTRPTTDLTAMAAGGHLVLNGDPADPPAVPAGELAWKQTSLTVAYAAMAIASAGHGAIAPQDIVVSVQEAVNLTTLQTANSNHHTWHAHSPSREIRPADFTTVRSADGWVSFTIHPPYWDRFVSWAESVLGSIGLEGPEWQDPQYVLGARDLVGQHVAALAERLSSAELIEHGQSLGLLVLPVQDATAVANDTHLAQRDFWETVDTPEGPTTIPGSPYRTSSGRARRGAVPELGEADGVEFEPTPPTPARTAPVDPHQPLAGIRVVDFGWAIAGPLTTRLLASLGAEVIKLESENRMDPIRLIGVQPPDLTSLNTNGVFNDCNANKRAITLNVDSAEGRGLAWRLIETADVVTANYSPERLDVWGFGWEELRRRNPGLVVANLAVMGMSGPNLGWRSYGSGIVAMCGLARHSNPDDRVPACLGTLHTDFTVPFIAASGIMAALSRRRRTGEGLYLEMAQYETAVRLMDAEVAGAMAGQAPAPRIGNRSERHAPNAVIPCRGHDEWLALACRDDVDWRALVSVIPTLDGLDRWTDQNEVERVLGEWSSVQDRWAAAEQLAAGGVPAAAVERLEDHRSPDNPLYDLWEHQQHDGIDSTALHLPLLWSGERLPLRPAPDWFADTVDVVMGELGVDPDRFAELVARNVIW